MSRPNRPFTLHVVAALIQEGHRVLLDRRHQGSLAGHWEFPGGKVEPGETGRQALRRELWEELGVEASVGDEVARSTDVSRDVEITLVLYEASLHGQPQAVDVEVIRWFHLDELDELPMPPADRPLVEVIRRRHAARKARAR
ncbi:MAG: (deoxy)nucleoside triphosphate pyrophosphohydrolase [Deltaproteobacteria bacterium]|nr:(deoxy)nucleoside triphosphate pyrophosphohydrolase [Deltaproteobacteria bacterium]